ncbi:MAG: 1-phosphofructokinase family hexose kinase [Vallitaleaceae bacterium]|nr:1-phosphofructokinase family hexose kinase [Vallitaleaceae bacterium]
MILAITMNPAIDKIYFVPQYTLGEVHRPHQMIASPGGKGLNVARVAKLMGEDVTASGLLGGGNGNFIREKIKDLGLIDGFLEISGETRICINVTNPENDLCTEVLEPGPIITEAEASQYLVVFTSLVQYADVVTLSGSLPNGLMDNYYQQLITLAKEAGKKVLLDSSGTAFLNGLKAKPTLVKPNDDEIKSVYTEELKTRQDYIQAIHKFKALGIEWPVISRGKVGAIVGLTEGIFEVKPPVVRVVNSVGSGDSFIAGCAVGISRGLSEVDWIRMGAACGTANTQYAQTGFVERETVEKYFKQITVEQIASYE